MKTPDKVRGKEDEQVHIGDSLLKRTKYLDFRTIKMVLDFLYYRGSYGSTDKTEMSSAPWNATGVPAGTMDTLSIPPPPFPVEYNCTYVCILQSTARQMMFKTNFSSPRVANMFTAVVNLKRPQEKERKVSLRITRKLLFAAILNEHGQTFPKIAIKKEKCR